MSRKPNKIISKNKDGVRTIEENPGDKIKKHKAKDLMSSKEIQDIIFKRQSKV